MNNAILIDHTVCELKVDGERKFVFQTPKSKASIRSLPLDPVFKDILLKRKQEQEEYRQMFGKVYNSAYRDYIMVNPLGELMRPDKISKKFHEVAERLGFGKMRFHDLRHPYVKPATQNILSFFAYFHDWNCVPVSAHAAV